MTARFTHVNLIAKDWKRLAAFYERALDCEPVLPERDLAGAWLDRATGISNAHIRGIHLRLPGYPEGGPTLEIFQYDTRPQHLGQALDLPGFGHLAFAVDNVEAAAARILTEGGRAVGELTRIEIAGAGPLAFQYLADPEGNCIEIQRWGV